MFYNGIGYSRLIRGVYRNRSAIIIQRWWRNQLLKRMFRRIVLQTIKEDFVLR